MFVPSLNVLLVGEDTGQKRELEDAMEEQRMPSPLVKNYTVNEADLALARIPGNSSLFSL